MSGYGDRKRSSNVFGEPEEEDRSPQPKKLKGNAVRSPAYAPGPESAADLTDALQKPSFLPPQMPAMPPSSLPTAPPPVGGAGGIDIMAKRAEIQAKLAAMRKLAPGGGAASTPSPPPPSSLPPPPPSLPSVPGLPRPNLDPDLAKKVADAKRLVESMQAKKRAAAMPANPYLSGAQPKKSDPELDPSLAGRGGLAMAAHPLLMDNSVPIAQTRKDRYRPMAPKFSSTKANARLPPPPPPKAAPSPAPEATPDTLVDTPFYDPRLGYGSAGATGRSHMGRGHARETLKFNQKGKFVKLGEAIRAEARMEDLKKRILESARKAGLESEMEDQARVIKRPAPPDVEWWDAPFLEEKTYESFKPEALDSSAAITIYVQHPIQIPAPQDKIKVEAKALFLTKKEMKKMRKQRRMAALKDRQDRVKMGLLPPDPPKVKLSNMMRVLTHEAVNDPTKVEAQVRREMVAREKGHIKMNQERKLTDEERKAKALAKAEADAAKGIGALVFKVRYLSNPSHKYKVKKNAIDDHLTGVICHNPRFCLIVVEGGAKGLKHYRNLMLNRIDWTEEVRVREGDAPPPVPVSTESIGGPMDELAEPQSLADNYCTLVWEGQHRERMFREIRNANCPSEAAVKEALGPKLEGLWDVAKIEVKEED